MGAGMTTTDLTLPRTLPVQGIRPPKENVPQTLGERLRIRDLAIAYVAEKKPTPPLPSPTSENPTDDPLDRDCRTICPAAQLLCVMPARIIEQPDTVNCSPFDEITLPFSSGTPPPLARAGVANGKKRAI